ncbi:MAG: metallophosphoesterase family protein [Anaerolineae bacterium]
MTSIVHLSDLHAGFRNLIEHLRDLVVHLKRQLQPASEYVIVITGDLVEKPDRRRPYQTTHDVLDELRKAGFNVLMVPGNHDYNNGLLLDKYFVPRFKEVFYGDPHVQYPRVDIVNDIAFIGLDSLAEELHWYDRMFADGELGEAQLRRLDDLLGDSTVTACAHRVVYLHHHPSVFLPFGELKDAAALREILVRRGNVDALLFGHHHMGRSRCGLWGIPRYYDGGTATGKRPGAIFHRILHLDEDPSSDFNGALCDFEGKTEAPETPAP